MDLTLFLLRHKVYPQLSHSKVFGDKTGKGGGRECPVCGKARALHMIPDRCHGTCRVCGRVSWLKYLQRHDRLTPAAAFVKAAGLAGIALGDKTAPDVSEVVRVDRVADLLEEALGLCIRALRKGPGLTVLTNLLVGSGLDRALAARLEVGITPRGDRLPKALMSRGFSMEEIRTLGLETVGNDPARLVFGHRDLAGALTGLVGLDADAYLVGRRRYGYTHETDLSVPFNIHKARGARRVLVSLDLFQTVLLDALGMRPVVGLRKRGFTTQLTALYREGARTFLILAPTATEAAISTAGAHLRQLADTQCFIVGEVGRPAESGLIASTARGNAEALIKASQSIAEWDVDRALAPFSPEDTDHRSDAVEAVYPVWSAVRGTPMMREVTRHASRRLSISEADLDAQLHAAGGVIARRQRLARVGQQLEEATRLYVMGDLDGVTRVLSPIGAGHSDSDSTLPPEPFDMARSISRLRTSTPPLHSGYPELDKAVAILPSDLVVIAARPSHGKTTFALNLTLNALALDPIEGLRRPFFFYCYELAPEFLLAKVISRLSGRYSFQEAWAYLRGGESDDPVMEEGRQRVAGFGDRLYLVGRPELTVEALAAGVRTARAQRGQIGAVVVDYLQIVPTQTPFATREAQVIHVLRQLRRLAQDIDAPVVCLAQANPAPGSGDGARPQIDHIVESATVEQEATTILMLHNEGIQRAQATSQPSAEDIATLELIVRKNKYGPVNESVLLDYRMRTGEIRPRGGFARILEV